MKNALRIKRMVGISTIAALVVVLQLISNYIQFGTVSITLALIPLVVGAILYGPLVGFGLGAIMGLIILAAPSTVMFLSFNPFGTVVLCVLKTGLAGLAAGWIYKGIIRITALKKVKFPVAVITATLLTPLINTAIFVLGTAVLFQGVGITTDAGEFVELVPAAGEFGAAFTAAVGFVAVSNFLIEFLVCVLLSPAVVYLFKVLGKTYDLSFSKDFKRGANQEDIIDLKENMENR